MLISVLTDYEDEKFVVIPDRCDCDGNNCDCDDVIPDQCEDCSKDYCPCDDCDKCSDEDTCLDNHDVEVEFTNHYGDMLALPVYWSIVHCIPADFSFGGATAKSINEVYDLEHILEANFGKENKNGEISVGDIVAVNNVITLFPNARKYTKTSKEALMECVDNLIEACNVRHIMHLAMPHIGCGRGGLDWEEIQDEIITRFSEGIDHPMEVMFCSL